MEVFALTLFLAFVDDDHVDDLVIKSCLDSKIFESYVIPIKE